MSFADFSMKRVTTTIKFSAVAFLCIILALALFPLRNGGSLKKADADSLDVYAGGCLGGWQDPGSATGAPDGNSAVLDDTQAQLFCGSFEGSDQSQSPQAVTLYFSWNVAFPDAASATIATGTPSGDASWASVLDSTDTPPVASSSASSSSGVAPSGSGADVATTTVAATSTSAPAGGGDASSEEDGTNASSTVTATTSVQDSASSAAPLPPAATSTPAPAPAPASDTAAQSSTSLLNEIFRSPFAFIARPALADSSGTAASDTVATDTVSADTSQPDAFLDVSYSLDGVTWQDLGEVSAENWQNFSVTIPVSSWSDINALQVRLTPLITADPPVISLDSMWLEVDYTPSITDIIQQGTNDTLNALSDIGDAVDNAISSILPGNTSDTQSQDLSATPAPQPQSQPQPQPSAPPAVAAHQYSFQTGSGIAVAIKNLPWVPADDLNSYNASAAAASSGQLPTVTVVDGNSIRVAGTCSEAYYVILLFANASDYMTDPARAFFNQARPCVNGSFARTIVDSELPSQLAAGTYYLVVANQGDTGPWQPFPQIYPVTITNTSPSSSQ